MNVPKELKYTKDHEWLSLDGEVATVGVTDFAQSELGDIVYVEVETLDETLEKEEVFGTVEAVKTVSELYIPLSGKITEINPWKQFPLWVQSFVVAKNVFQNFLCLLHFFRRSVVGNSD